MRQMHKHIRGIDHLFNNASMAMQLVRNDMAMMSVSNPFQQPSDIFLINKSPRPKKMAVAAVSSSLVGRPSPSSSASSSLVPAKLHHSPLLRTLFAVPLSSTRRVRMAQSITTRATLGLTKPGSSVVPKIAFAAKEVDFSEWKGDILVVTVSEKDMSKNENSNFMTPALRRLDGILGGVLGQASAEEDFTGKAGQSMVLRLSNSGFKRIGLFGLGQCTPSAAAIVYRGLGEVIAGVVKAVQASNVAVLPVSFEGSEESKTIIASAITSGIFLGVYEDYRFKTESKKPLLKSVDILGLGAGPLLEKKLKYTTDVCSGVILGRELVNAPANVLTPVVLAEEASKIASRYSDVLTATILDVDQCKELKMGSYLGVAAASANPPRFIHIHYKPPSGQVKTKLAIVGKGLTFDSGGYNLKTGPGCMIELMKFDMGGSAATLGAAKAIGEIKPSGVEVHFIVAACENMISGTGMRPGDILTASNGKTIEVNNTDAEGRLTLADALVYACNQGAEKVVDLATLTGACIIALGSNIAGIFTPSDDLSNEIFAASKLSGEKFWRMPLEESYWESMKSGVADMVNTGGRQGGAITAALFLKQLFEIALEACGNDLDSAIKSLNELSLGSSGTVSDTGMGTNDQQPSEGGDPALVDAAAQNNLPTNGSDWVELLVSEMMNASDMDGAKGCASRVLEAFEKSVASRAIAETAEHFHQKENMLKEHCELLKRAVRIQHIREHSILKRVDERKTEDDERMQELQKQLVATEHEHQKKSQELQQVKQLLSQSQVECYALTMQLRQALQSNSSIPDRFHPHVF